MKQKIAIIGGGNLATAIAEGLIASGFAKPADIIITKRNTSTLKPYEKKGVHVTNNNSEAVKKYATSRGALFAPSSGEVAQKAVFPAVQANAWLLFDSGKAKVSPDTVGIPKI